VRLDKLVNELDLDYDRCKYLHFSRLKCQAHKAVRGCFFGRHSGDGQKKEKKFLVKQDYKYEEIKN
jgi:hypothetical protein